MGVPRSVAILVALASLSHLACGTTYHVSRPDSVVAFQELTGGRSATVVTDPPPATAPEPQPTTVAFHGQAAAPPPPGSGGAHHDDLLGFDAPDLQRRGVWIGARERPAYVSLQDVRAVQVRDHTRGALEGLGIGLLSGAAIGGLAGYVGDDPPCSSAAFICLRGTAREQAVLAGIGGALSGAVIGAVVGAIVGHRYSYVF